MTNKYPPTEREMKLARNILEFLKTNPSSLHAFRTAVFGHDSANLMRQHDFPPERFLEAANMVGQAGEDDCQRFLGKNSAEVANQLRDMATEPDNQANREWLLHVEYFVENPNTRPRKVRVRK